MCLLQFTMFLQAYGFIQHYLSISGCQHWYNTICDDFDDEDDKSRSGSTNYANASFSNIQNPKKAVDKAIAQAEETRLWENSETFTSLRGTRILAN